MKKPTIALITASAARELDEDLRPLATALYAAGAGVQVIEWDEPDIDWEIIDLALLRSTWGYDARLPEFLRWCERTAAATLLLNPLPVIRWNTDKHYLHGLSQAGLPTVPSEFVEPGADADQAITQFIARLPTGEFVVKPAVGAGARDAQRYLASERTVAIPHAKRLLDAGRSVLLQPYLDHVDDYGETALIYFAGEFSHAIRKGPLLRQGQAPTEELFAAEEIAPRAPEAAELQLAARTLTALPFATPLYARVDIIRDLTGAPCVLEVELTEPSLFFAHAPGSAERFAAAILQHMRRK
jgi:glutathione synthase/RimK-type ligase-like ATP-grasp enzyme